MINQLVPWMIWRVVIAGTLFACTATGFAQKRSVATQSPAVAKSVSGDTMPAAAAMTEAQIIGKTIHFADGSSIQADEVWKNGDDLWYRRGTITERLSRPVKSVEPVRAPTEKPEEKPAETAADAQAATENSQPAEADSLWVMLKGGARMKVDDVTENEAGAWCRRGNFSVLIARERIDRIERDSVLAKNTGWKQRDWTTGNQKIDQLIRANGSRFGVDPYLIFCLIEHESQFHTRALSPKGAQGLMQLMPGTAGRFGVRRPFDPAENIFGGTQYLKELLKMFGGRVDLALASYNAGEGAVIKYGGNIPPYRETREYVKRITRRYGAYSKDKR